jgi:hypothetical protein
VAYATLSLFSESPANMEFFETRLAVKDPQARRLSNPEVATKHRARTE